MAITLNNEGPANSAPSQVSDAPIQGSPPFPNILHDYSSYSYIITLSCITTEQCNSSEFRGLGPNSTEIICRSAGGFPDNRQNTILGKFDFMIEDLTINSSAGLDQVTKNTNASGIKFKVVEPYSMGLFYQALQVAATRCGHVNFNTASYLLTIEFSGHVSADKLNVKVPNTTKYIVMRIGLMEMAVTAAGAVYNITAYPWNEQSYQTIYTEFTTDVSVAGKNVLEMCVGGGAGGIDKNLKSIVNQKFKEAAKQRGDPYPDQIDIIFPKHSGDTSPLNEISEATMNFDTFKTAPPGMGKEDQIYDPATGTFFRNKIVANKNIAEFKFSQGSDLVNAINQIVLMSDYGRKALESVDKNGMVSWWKVEVQHFQVEGILKKDGQPPALSIYRVIPYKTHISRFSSPNAKLTGLENLRKEALKEYNYIYTGKNVDVLKFDIRYNFGFYNPAAADLSLNSGDRLMNSQLSNSTSVAPVPEVLPIEVGDPNKTESPTRTVPLNTRSTMAGGGGGGRDDAASLAARQFFDVTNDPSSLVMLDITILGDPYFLGDSGLGNYSANPTSLFNMNSDGAINWQNGEVDVKINFRTPVDPNPPTGLYSFPPKESETKIVEQVSGLYKVYQLESNFSKGQFTQTLKLSRRLHQFSENAEAKSLLTPEVTAAGSRSNG
jgi:hypothetical protein